MARSRAVRAGGPPQPPFARNQPMGNRVYEHHELVWGDHVAPELALDFDAQYLSNKTVWKMVGAAWAGVFTIYQLVKLSDPEGSRPALYRKETVPETAFNPAEWLKKADKEAAAEEE